jgi:hypothetical protein
MVEYYNPEGEGLASIVKYTYFLKERRYRNEP